MKSKLGIYLISLGVPDIADYVARAQPRVAVSMEHNLEAWRAMKQASPNTFVIGRYYVDDPDQKYEDDPEGRAEQFFGLMRPEAEKMRGVYDAWMSYNEIGLGKDEGAKERARRYSRFHVRWGDLMRQAGFTSCAYSFATGNPELDLWRYLAEGLYHCDLLSLHEYSAPMMAQDQSWLCLRYRRAIAALAPEARRPVVITECGIDGGPIGQAQAGWSKFTSEAGYLDSLKWYDAELQKDDYVLGAAIFAMNGWGIDGSFGMGHVSPIREYIAQGGRPTPVVLRPPAVLPTEPVHPGHGETAAAPAITYPRYIYGLHDLGGENLMLEAGTPGWVVVTTRARDVGGDYSAPASAGLGVIVRLNHDYGSGGTLPASTEYDAFAQQCAAFVGRSRGANIWIIGNETNLAVERSGNTGANDGEVITPDKYAQCFARCRAAILGVPGHADDWIAPAPPGPWNNQTIYPANPSGDWVKYYQDILNLLVNMQAPPSALVLHTYTHGFEPGLISSEEPMGPPFAAYHCHFRAYRDFLGVVPASLRALPVFITETQPADPAWWQNRNTGWIQAAYDEINAWNADPAHQAIRALCLFRWERGDDRWSISDKPALHDDFRAALRNLYQVKPAVPVSPPPQPTLQPPTQVPSETGWCPFAIKRPTIARNFGVGREGHKVQAVVLHIAAGNMANVLNTFNTSPSPVSAHFCVGRDGKIEQYVSIDDTAYGNGLGYKDGQWLNPRGAPVKPTWQDLVPGLNPNLYTVSIEHDGQPQNEWTREMDDANTRLLQWIAQQCGLTYVPHRTLIGHCEIDPSKPNCPGPHVNYEQIAAAANAPVESPARDAAIQAARDLPWLPINVDSALGKFARANNLGCPQTDEFDFQVDGAAYVGQVYSRGIVYVKKGDWGNVARTAKPEAGAGAADATANVAVAAAGRRTWMPINTESALYKFAQARQLGCPQTDEFEFAVASTRYVGQVYAHAIVYAEKANLANVAFAAKPEARAVSFAGPEAPIGRPAGPTRIARARRAPAKKTRRSAKKTTTRARRAKPLAKRKGHGRASR